MSTGSLPTKRCLNRACATHNIEVRTDLKECVSCGSDLNELNPFFPNLFAAMSGAVRR